MNSSKPPDEPYFVAALLLIRLKIRKKKRFTVMFSFLTYIILTAFLTKFKFVNNVCPQNVNKNFIVQKNSYTNRILYTGI